MKRPMASQEERDKVMSLLKQAKTADDIRAAVMSLETPSEVAAMFDERGDWIVEFEDDD